MAGTTLVIIPNRSSSLDHTGIRAGVWIHLGMHHSTNEVMLYQLLSIYEFLFLLDCIIYVS